VSGKPHSPPPRFVGTSIRRRLVVSHLVAVTASTLVYAIGGFFLLICILYVYGNYTSFRDMAQLLPEFAGLTGFVLVQIALITLCGVIVARITSRIVSRPLLRQIEALRQGTDAVATGDYTRQVEVINNDELGHFAASFNALTQSLDRADRQRKAFVANISHDLRTPIAVIRGHLDVQMNDDRSDDIPPADSFAAIDHEVQTLSSLIEDLFTSSRIEDGVLPVSLTPVDVGEIVEEAVASVRPYALKTGKVSVHASVNPGPNLALADATRVAQIVNNLVHNAIRHTPAGGLVLVEVTSVSGSRWLTMTIRDTGEGMPPEVLARVFDRYYQGDEIGEKGGAGLGMSIVQSLVRMLNGEVKAESTLGEGTAITVRLPAVVPSDGPTDRGRSLLPGL
jgi:two-component system sensor histidine kinase BaeS